MMKKSAFSNVLAWFAVLSFTVNFAVAQSTDTTLPQNSEASQAENAAPSQHIFFDFPSDAVARIHQIKITRSADAEYFSVHNFRGGYDGLQQTPDKDYGVPNILIASLWDPNTAGKVFSKVTYAGKKTFTGRFGGEGDGWKTINPYQWKLNTWYNIAVRSWKDKGELYIATFIQDMGTGIWFHTSTLAQADRDGYLGKRDDAFLENWDGANQAWDGRHVRKAYFKDCWSLNTDNKWEKHSRRFFNANGNDKARNGRYDRSFNAGYDAAEDAYFMQHGGDTEPAESFGSGRRLDLPEQANQGNAPKLTAGAVLNITATYAAKTIKITWKTDVTKSPQLSSKIEVLNTAGKIIQTVNEILPQKRTAVLKASLPAGKYLARLTITDIFNQVGEVMEKGFVVR